MALAFLNYLNHFLAAESSTAVTSSNSVFLQESPFNVARVPPGAIRPPAFLPRRSNTQSVWLFDRSQAGLMFVCHEELRVLNAGVS